MIHLNDVQRALIAAGARVIDLTPEQDVAMQQLQQRAEQDQTLTTAEEVYLLRHKIELLEERVSAMQTEVAELRGTK
jgi:hypothetical protein